MARAPKICSEPGCPNLQPCELHKKEPWANSTRRLHTKVSGSREQRRNRLVMRKFYGVCHVCGQPGADQIDHVIPLAEHGPDELDNLRPIHAKPCHAEKTQAEARRARGL